METNNLEQAISKNQREIDLFLSVDLPLDIIYFNVRRLSAINEKLLNVVIIDK